VIARGANRNRHIDKRDNAFLRHLAKGVGDMAGVRHFLLIAFLITIGGLTFQCTKDSPKEPSLADTFETPDWFLNGKPAPLSASLTALTDSIIPSLGELVPKWYRCKSDGIWQIDTVGKWSGRIVIDLFYVIPCRQYPDTLKQFDHRATKAIAIETSKDKFRLCALTWSEPYMYSFDSSKIIQSDGTSVLYNRFLESCQHPLHEYYWIWDEKERSPIGLYWIPKLTNKNRPIWLYFNSLDRMYFPANAGTTLDTLIGHYVRSLLDRISHNSKQWEIVPFHWHVDTIGIMHGKAIVKIPYSFQYSSYGDSTGKVIAVESPPQKFSPLYIEYSIGYDSGTQNDTIIRIGEIPVIEIGRAHV
jgi:hypothetical protein